jgi:hypothetical protein
MAALPKGKQSKQQQTLWKMWNHEFRQPLGETATIALADELKKRGGGVVPFHVETAVDTPNDVFDTYGRFIGDVVIAVVDAFNVNQWLAAEGWAFPTFYASMSSDEIERLRALAATAKSRKAGVGGPPATWLGSRTSILPSCTAARAPRWTRRLTAARSSCPSSSGACRPGS